MSRVTTTVGAGRGVCVATATEGPAVTAGVADGDPDAPAAQPPSRKVRARPATSRTAGPRAFIPDLLWDARECTGASEPVRPCARARTAKFSRSEEHTSELQSRLHLLFP